MQIPKPLSATDAAALENTLSSGRVGRYMKEAAQDRHYAIQLYLWNTQICQAFYFPLQIAEIAVRNACQEALRYNYQQNWYGELKFLNQLKLDFRSEISRVTADEKGQHGAITDGHVVSGLSFGFWEHMLSKNFQHLLWKGGVKHQFPGAPIVPISKVRERVEEVRIWRNRIAHYKTVFDRQPQIMHEKIIELIGWRNASAGLAIRRMSTVLHVIGARPAA